MVKAHRVSTGLSGHHVFNPVETLNLRLAVRARQPTVVLSGREFELIYSDHNFCHVSSPEPCFQFKPLDGSLTPCGYIAYKTLEKSEMV